MRFDTVLLITKYRPISNSRVPRPRFSVDPKKAYDPYLAFDVARETATPSKRLKEPPAQRLFSDLEGRFRAI